MQHSRLGEISGYFFCAYSPKKTNTMTDLDEHGQACEEMFGLISGGMLFGLWEMSTAAGSSWDWNDIDTMEIIVNKSNAASIYAWCKEIRSGYNIGMSKATIKKVKDARMEAHLFLVQEANNPNTSIDRKIELVRLTSK